MLGDQALPNPFFKDRRENEVVLTTEAGLTIDLIAVERNLVDGTGYEIVAMHSRALNDRLLVSVFPRGTVLTDRIHSTRVDHFKAPNFDGPIQCLEIPISDGSAVMVAKLPLLHQGILRTITFTFRRGHAEAVTLFEFRNARGFRIGSEDFLANEPARRLTCQVGPEAGLTVFADGEHHMFDFAIHTTSALALTMTVDLDNVTGAVRVSSSPKDSVAGGFALTTTPMLGENFVAGLPTSSFSEAPLILVSYEPLRPGNVLWMVCCFMPRHTLPLAIPPKGPFRYAVPYIGFAIKSGWMLGKHEPKGDGADLHAMLLGNPESEHVLAIARGGRFGQLHVVTDDATYAADLDLNLATAAGQSASGYPPSSGSEPIPVSIDIVDFLNHERLEDATIQRLAKGDPYSAEHDLMWKHHLEHRLPCLPLPSDPVLIGAVVVTNLLRGRLPPGPNGSLDRTELINNERWLIPWPDLPANRAALQAGIVRRATCEYLALTACWTLIGGVWPGNGTVSQNVQDGRLITYLENWMYGTFEATSAGDDLRSAAKRLVAEKTLSPRYVASTWAAHLFDTVGERRIERRQAFANPLVLVVLCEPNAQYSESGILEHDLALWAMYAGTASRRKAGALVTSIITREASELLTHAHHTLRELYRADSSATDVDAIRELRRSIGLLLIDGLDTSVSEVLDSVGSDRVVAFSATSLDLLPYGSGILGLEIPTSRLPVTPAFGTVGSAISSATRGQSTSRGGTVNRDMTATIFRSASASDPQTDWSLRAAEATVSILREVGLQSIVPTLTRKELR